MVSRYTADASSRYARIPSASSGNWPIRSDSYRYTSAWATISWSGKRATYSGSSRRRWTRSQMPARGRWRPCHHPAPARSTRGGCSRTGRGPRWKHCAYPPGDPSLSSTRTRRPRPAAVTSAANPPRPAPITTMSARSTITVPPVVTRTSRPPSLNHRKTCAGRQNRVQWHEIPSAFPDPAGGPAESSVTAGGADPPRYPGDCRERESGPPRDWWLFLPLRGWSDVRAKEGLELGTVDVSRGPVTYPREPPVCDHSSIRTSDYELDGVSKIRWRPGSCDCLPRFSATQSDNLPQHSRWGFDSESRIQPSTDGPSCAPNGRHDRSSQSAPFSSSCSGGGFANVDGSVCPLP